MTKPFRSNCVLCRRSIEPGVAKDAGSGSSSRPLVLLGVLVGVVLAAAGVVLQSRPRDPGALVSVSPNASEVTQTVTAATPVAPDELPEIEGELATRNGSGRSGAFYLPPRSATIPIPVLVVLHGQGGEGRDMVGAFRPLASRRRFAVIGPSSNFVSEMHTMTWTVGDKPNDITADYRHVQACFEEVTARTDVTLDRSRALIAGFSGGGSSAPYVATNAAPYTAFAVLHGGLYPDGLGSRRIRGWFSTGESDPARTPAHVSGHFRTLQERGFDVVFHLYPGGHVISVREAEDLIDWWLGSDRSDRDRKRGHREIPD